MAACSMKHDSVCNMHHAAWNRQSATCKPYGMRFSPVLFHACAFDVPLQEEASNATKIGDGSLQSVFWVRAAMGRRRRWPGASSRGWRGLRVASCLSAWARPRVAWQVNLRGIDKHAPKGLANYVRRCTPPQHANRCRMQRRRNIAQP